MVSRDDMVMFHNMHILLRISAFLLSFAALSVNAQSLTERAKNDELAFMQDEEPAMRKAFQAARATLDEFLEKAKSHPPGTSSYAVKVGVKEGKNTEYFWIAELASAGDEFVGRLSNQPRIAKSVKLGQTYRFSKSQIVDWTYLDRSNGKMAGNFTACALLSKEPPAEAEAMKKRHGLSCD